ncbi:hypothetical protein [Rhodopirellula halodulae]|uniref:hypothetical protein n=1 Tax=Rhodopirellula halodulae TaxID=2894198 RepID=UPI001E44E0FD|nr:hypothetical protein [Rhodopirellula sp. JC737]MCC9655271.1 hypothetical protein [Rhodopirellula sp. JC737]
MSEPLFPMGQLLISRTALESLSHRDIHQALTCHASGEFGDLCPADIKENIFSIDCQLRILSKYKGEGGDDFYVETAADRSHTTVYLCDEY